MPHSTSTECLRVPGSRKWSKLFPGPSHSRNLEDHQIKQTALLNMTIKSAPTRSVMNKAGSGDRYRTGCTNPWCRSVRGIHWRWKWDLPRSDLVPGSKITSHFHYCNYKRFKSVCTEKNVFKVSNDCHINSMILHDVPRYNLRCDTTYATLRSYSEFCKSELNGKYMSETESSSSSPFILKTSAFFHAKL